MLVSEDVTHDVTSCGAQGGWNGETIPAMES